MVSSGTSKHSKSCLDLSHLMIFPRALFSCFFVPAFFFSFACSSVISSVRAFSSCSQTRLLASLVPMGRPNGFDHLLFSAVPPVLEHRHWRKTARCESDQKPMPPSSSVIGVLCSQCLKSTKDMLAAALWSAC
jgi:hypothetical protein